MTNQAFKADLRAAVEDAINEVGMTVFKSTSMFPLSRRKAAAVEQNKAA